MNGNRLQSIRHRLGLNTEALGVLLSVSRRAVENWEQDRRAIPPEVELALTGVCPCCKKSAPELKIAVPKSGS
jgi:DNA-binding transcriptional regulator YiaG